LYRSETYRKREATLRLLEVKDSDIRLDNLFQCRYAVDHAIHIGGAFSATIPMICLFYGGIINVNVEQPTDLDQDIFVLSKGHAVATLASIYADLGYFDRSLLQNSRSISSILNGHPGPLLPGVHVATGPMGQGMGVAQGFAIRGQTEPRFDVFCLTGDGELQEGPIWEAVMYTGYKRLENLCVMVDHNAGQLDITNRLHFPYHDLAASFRSFGWKAIEVDATRLHMVWDALSQFKFGERDGRPTVIICNTSKGHGGFSDHMNRHKTTITGDVLDREEAQHQQLRHLRVEGFCRVFNEVPVKSELRQDIFEIAKLMRLKIDLQEGRAVNLNKITPDLRTKKAPERDKKLRYDSMELPKLKLGMEYAASHVIRDTISVFATDPRVVSIDSDLASTSGLQAGVGSIDQRRALNVGVAEANMMLVGEAFAILGSNVWVSTFCPFFDWKVLRRIAVGHQERLEVIADQGWLSQGHGLDYTMIATAADFETQANGATHMGNDDVLIFDAAAHINIINIACPQMLLSLMKWIAEGNKGILYVRTLRAAAPVIYDEHVHFEINKSYALRNIGSPDTYVVSTCRGVHEALEAADKLSGFAVEVIDMPTIDPERILELYRSCVPVFIAEQNNGYLWNNFQRVLFSSEKQIKTKHLIPINAATSHGRHYIHSGTYQELASAYGLDADSLTKTISTHLKNNNENNS